MNIEVINWKYENIRKMGNVEVEICKKSGEIYPVSLIMMPNGTGKTTTVTLLRGILSGRAVSWDEKMVRSFAPTRVYANKGKFTLKVSFDKKIYFYILHLDYEHGKAFIQTSMTGESGGLDDGWETPSILKGIIDNEEFVNRFVFDGEQARKTLSSGNEEAEKAIVYSYQINKFDDLINEVDKLVKIKQEHGIGKNTSRSMKVLLGKYQTRENTVLDLKQRLNKASNQLRIKEAKKKNMK